MERHKTANILRNIARYMLLLLWILVFILSFNPKDFDIVLLLPLVLILIAWKWEFIGGISITLSGIAILYLRNFSMPIIIFIIFLLIIIFGSFFILSWHLRKSKKRYY